MQLNDAKAERIELSGYDSEYDWLLSASNYQPGDPAHIADMWNTYLTGEGYTGNLNDMKQEFFKDQLGATDSDHITDLEYAFWSLQTPLPLPAP